MGTLGVANLSVGAENKNAHIKLSMPLAFIMLEYNNEAYFLRTYTIPGLVLCAVDTEVNWNVYWSAPKDHMLPSSSVLRRPILRSEFCFFYSEGWF